MIPPVVTKALQDVGLPYNVIEQAAVGYVYGKTNAFVFSETCVVM